MDNRVRHGAIPRPIAYAGRLILLYLTVFMIISMPVPWAHGAVKKSSTRHRPRHLIRSDAVIQPPDDTVGDAPSGAPVSVNEPFNQALEASPAEYTGLPDPAPGDAELPETRTTRQEQGNAVLNFYDANLRDILRTVAEITGENFIIAPGITARISVQTARPVPKKEVFGIFESILEVNGLAAVKAGPYYKIVPAQSARQRAIELLKKTDELPPGDRLINLIVPVEYIPANDIVQIIKPALSGAGNVTSHAKTNTLIITDTASNIKGHLDIINTIDVDAFEEKKVSHVQIKNVDAKTITKELNDVLGALGFGKDTPQIEIVPVERLNSLIVFSSNPGLLESVNDWIGRLDRPSSAEGTSIHIYYVQNDKATNIKNILEQLFGTKKAGSSGAAAAQAQNYQPAGAPAQSNSLKYEGQTRPDLPGDEVKIYLYEPGNALIFHSSQRDYQNILNTIKELDRPPKQVLIDAMIAEVKLDENTKYGIQWSVLTGNFNIQQNTGILSTTLANPRAAIPFPTGLPAPGGLTAIATDASKFFSVIQALASTGKVEVLSNPHVLVKNYEKASINVGSDEPVATQSTQTAVTGTAGLIQNIEYRKTGVILTVVPQITEGGMVAMTIRQEVSDKSTDRTVGNAVYPSFTKREAETSVVAKDRETLVIGGLIQDKKDRSASGIPLLSSIPLLGSLFRFTTINNGKTELIILLTPTVISNSEQASTVTGEIRNRLGGLKALLKEKAYGR